MESLSVGKYNKNLFHRKLGIFLRIIVVVRGPKLLPKERSVTASESGGSRCDYLINGGHFGRDQEVEEREALFVGVNGRHQPLQFHYPCGTALNCGWGGV